MLKGNVKGLSAEEEKTCKLIFSDRSLARGNTWIWLFLSNSFLFLTCIADSGRYETESMHVVDMERILSEKNASGPESLTVPKEKFRSSDEHDS